MSRERRERMVEEQVAGRGIRDARLLDAMRRTPREPFLDAGLANEAYEDGPLPIGEGQTISQPYVVALMIEALAVGERDCVLEVGAGSGYAAALLGRLAARVHAIERHAVLAEAARARLAGLGLSAIRFAVGDGTRGWPEAAPFDAILVSAGGPAIPPPLVNQLAPGGRLVMPVGPPGGQRLVKVTRAPDGDRRDDFGPVSFVPLIAG